MHRKDKDDPIKTKSHPVLKSPKVSSNDANQMSSKAIKWWGVDAAAS